MNFARGRKSMSSKDMQRQRSGVRLQAASMDKGTANTPYRESQRAHLQAFRPIPPTRRTGSQQARSQSSRASGRSKALRRNSRWRSSCTTTTKRIRTRIVVNNTNLVTERRLQAPRPAGSAAASGARRGRGLRFMRDEREGTAKGAGTQENTRHDAEDLHPPRRKGNR